VVKRVLGWIFAAAAIAFMLWLVAVSHLELTRSGLALADDLAGTIATMPAMYFLVFIVLLIVRYTVLIVMSFLEHLQGRREHPPADRLETPLVSIIVPAYNEELLIESALESLARLDYPFFEVIVVDDGSSDETAARARRVARATPRVSIRVLRKPNEGKARALNYAIAHARGAFVLAVDADAQLSPNSLRACIRHFEDPRVGAVAGNVKVANRETLLARIQALEYVEGLALGRRAQSLIRAVNIIPGPLGMFRKQALLAVGGYDHDTFAEDCDLTLKLLIEGWQVVYEPAAEAAVETPARLLDLFKQRYRWTRGILQAITKHSGRARVGAGRRPRRWVLRYMLFENVLWPLSTVAGTVFFAAIGLFGGATGLVFFWWLQLTLLDVIAAVYCVVVEREDPRLIPYALLFRTFYIVTLDVAKAGAILEELLGVRMDWGKLQRQGKL
jgi:poly-beta-1,6-N-acetyl-D-glucosamine synthase